MRSAPPAPLPPPPRTTLVPPVSPTLRLIQPDSIDPCLDRFARHAASRVAPLSTTHSLLASLQAHLSAQISEATGDQHTLALWFALTFGASDASTSTPCHGDGASVAARDLRRACIEHMDRITALHHGPLAFADASRFLMSIANNSIPAIDASQTPETASVLTSPVAVPVSSAPVSPFSAESLTAPRRPTEVWAPALLDLHLCVSAAAGFEHWRLGTVLTAEAMVSTAPSKKTRRLRLVG